MSSPDKGQSDSRQERNPCGKDDDFGEVDLFVSSLRAWILVSSGAESAHRPPDRGQSTSTATSQPISVAACQNVNVDAYAAGDDAN